MATTAERTTAEEADKGVPGGFPDAQSQEPAEIGPPPQQSLAHAVFLRRAEYSRPKNIKVKVATWNVASCKGSEKDIGGWLVGGKGVSEKLSGLGVDDDPIEAGKIKLVDREGVEEQEARSSRKESTIPKGDPGLIAGGEDIGIYAVGLQEIVDISSATEALRPYADPSVGKRYREEIERALPSGYVLVAEQQLTGLYLLIYAAPNVAPEVTSVSTTSVGTGLMGYMGNKGATTARLVLGETTRLVFVNCHLAAGADAASLERRNWDAQQILHRTRFDPMIDAAGMQQEKGEVIGDEDFAFWFGDLNYRLQGLPADDIRRLLTLHARDEYDLSQRHPKKIEAQFSDAEARFGRDTADVEKTREINGSAHGDDSDGPEAEGATSSELDPASLQATLDGLLPHDELFEQMKKGKAFHDGWKEAPIKFMPTYKYDVGTVGVFDSSEKKRCPSWCDRILYRTRRDKLAYESKIKDEKESKQRDEQLKQSGVDQEAEDEAVMFEYNPDADGDDYDEFADVQESQVVVTKEGFEDEIRLETYTSHQRVLSSDHKPLVAVFSLTYDAVVPELKTKIHQEVAKDLDRAENEGRPTITLIVDHSSVPAKEEGDDRLKFEGLDFGDVRYDQYERRSVTIANTGQVPAVVSFADRPGKGDQFEGPMPSWLTAKFARAADDSPVSAKDTTLTIESKGERFTMEPGDATTVILMLHIGTTDLVKALNSGESSLEDILVLRVEGGRDHFLPIRAHWLQSSLGRSINKLIRIPEGGIRRLQQHKSADTTLSHKTWIASKKSEDAQPDSTAARDPVKWSAPRELFRLTEAVENIAQRCVADWDMQHAAPVDMAPALPPRPPAESPHETGEGPPVPPKLDPAEPTTPRQPRPSVSDDPVKAKPPWEAHSGWPFWEDSWSYIDKSLRDAASQAIYEALDTDKPFDQVIDPSTPNFPRLEAVAGALFTFLSSLTDGVITPEMWEKLETDLVARAKEDKQVKLSKQELAEEQKSRTLEIVSETPAHNVSFVLVATMLQRLIAELTASDLRLTTAYWQQKQENGLPTSTSPLAKGIPIPFTRRRALSRSSEDEVEKAEKAVQTRRKLRERAYAVKFADALIRVPHVDGMKEKEKRARDDRRISVLESFLVDEA